MIICNFSFNHATILFQVSSYINTMDKNEQKKLKKDLLTEKTNIEKVLGEFTTENPTVKGDYKSHFHSADQSDTSDEKAHSVTDSEQERAVEQNLELRLREINETIKKIDENTYGVCEKCSSPIDIRRLKVIPVARFCVDCAKKAILI
ncbi:MAG: TraR/DksA family transcriptional regulator [Candidatus Yanofskybacteria bacterium]|nr:TraR/DksA family transcriptional regulator [Candidatus Yanofskybacteria bacterium]